MSEESIQAFLQEWTPRNEKEREALLSMKNPHYRDVDWAEDNNITDKAICITSVARLLHREGPLIAKNLKLSFDEMRFPEWFNGTISLHDFLYRFGDWFDELYINTLSESCNVYHPMSKTKIAQIVEASKIASIVINARHIIPFEPLIRTPHVRKVTLINGWINPKTVEFFMQIGQQWDELILNDCRFDPGIIQLIQDLPLITIKITGSIELRTIEDQKILSTCPFITDHEYHHYGEDDAGDVNDSDDDDTDNDNDNDDDNDGDDDIGNIRIPRGISILSYLAVNSSITKLWISSYKSYDREIFFSTLATMTQLRKLSLSLDMKDNDIETLTTLTNLYKLCLCGNRSLSDKTITMLEKFPQLRSLDLSYSIDMTPKRCDLISQSCPRLDRLIWYYNTKYFAKGDPSQDVADIELLEMIRCLVRTMEYLRSLRVLMSYPSRTEEVKTFLSHQLLNVPFTLESISMGSWSRNLTELLQERQDMLQPHYNQYLYTVFILVRAWIQRVSSLAVLPKDIINLILTEHAPILGRNSDATREMLKYVWNNWKRMETLIQLKRPFKLVQSQDHRRLSLVGFTQDKRLEVIA